MKALKALVIGMGMLIVVGLALVGFGLYRNTVHPAPAKGVGAEAGGPYFSLEVPVASGSHLEQMAVAGDRVILRFSGAEGERILVLDPQTGHVTGTVSLIPQKP